MMKKAKRICGVWILLSMVLIGGCSKSSKEVLEVAALKGPTGIGMVKMLQDVGKSENPKYNMALYQSPDEILGKVVSGEVDLACIPSNLGAVLYNKTEGSIKFLATNTLGVLYIMENGNTIKNLKDLNNRTIVASGKESTPEFVLSYILNNTGLLANEEVSMEFMGNHADVLSKLVTEEDTVALLPEPFVTTALNKNDAIRVVVDVNEVWETLNHLELPMGILIANAQVLEERPEEIEQFLKDYKESVDFVNQHVEEASQLVAQFEIMPSAELAQQAIPKCHIVYEVSKEAKDALQQFYKILEEANPRAVGGKVPDENFYTY